MKSITLAIVGLFVSASAYAACPDLSGKFNCTYEDGATETLEITQSETAGVTTYVVNGNPLVADGVAVTLPDDASVKNQSMSYGCTGNTNKFVYNYKADLYEAGVLAGNMSSDLFLSKDATGALVLEDSGAFTLTDGSLYPWSSTMNCAAAL